MALLRVLAVLAAMLAAYLAAQPSFRPDRVRGQRVLITGASMGIGEELAYAYAKLGAKVVVVARSADKLKVVADKCKKLGAPYAGVISADLSSKDEAAYKKIVDEAVAQMDGLDTIVLNHVASTGLSSEVPWTKRFKLDELVDQYYLDVFSYFALSHYAIPHVQKNQGRVVVVSSGTGIIPLPKTVGYGSQKHALHGYFNSLRLDQEMHGQPYPSFTLCVLGAINTESLQKNLKPGAVAVEAESPAETALAILKSSEMRERTLYYPYSKLRPGHIMSVLFPQLMDMVALQVVRKV